MKLRSLGMVAIVLLAASCANGSLPPPPSTIASPTAGPSGTAAPTPAPTPATIDHRLIYLSRDRLPPVAVHDDGAGLGAMPSDRIRSRLSALWDFQANAPLINAVAPSQARPARVTIDGDLATVDFDVPALGWGIAGSAGTRAFLQQIVYTVAEEPGIRRVLITENGHQAVIGGEGLVVDHPVTRENVSGYSFAADQGPMTWQTEPFGAPVWVDTRYEVERTSPGLVRFIVDTHLMGEDAKAGLGFTIGPRPNDEAAVPELAKWSFRIDVPAAQVKSTGTSFVGTTPLRSVRTSQEGSTARYELGLDDLRPWRAVLLYEPLRLAIDIGGDPDAITRNIAVYTPAYGTGLNAPLAIGGLVRAFEAHYEYRFLARDGTVLLHGFGMASLGTSELWGEFASPVADVPAGAMTLEVFLRSPKDGNVSELVSLPLGP